ncbi:GEVED domain-containing protein [Roseimaritima sediminicola]|uniref:GEVED domain-containing protein n=1 Tax=Roseimaritima sediminicola TaxID=2662066 RepID=UPI001298405B|nr:GEVED domain-containing protein [Roseimaritima sediminicola]
MTSRNFGSRRSGLFSASDRRRAKRRQQNRKGLLEALEQRQLMAVGPELIGIQPNQGSLLFDGVELSVQPRELVFQFDETAQIDPTTLDGIQITRAGGDDQFEAAEATTDFGTGGAVLVDFRAAQGGISGNGITLEFTSVSSSSAALPTIDVDGKTISVVLNSNPVRETTVAGLLAALRSDAEASALVSGLQVTGGSSTRIGRSTPDGLQVVLGGANAATAITDFGTNNAVRVRVLSQTTGPEGRGQQLIVERRNFQGPALPAVLVNGNDVRVQINSHLGNETTVEQLINAINTNPQASQLLRLELQAGSPDTTIGDVATTYSPLTLTGASDVSVTPGYVGLGDSPREVVFRFAEPLPDDRYQINVFGQGAEALLDTEGRAFQDGQDFGLQFELDLGPQVLAVVPEPVRRGADGRLSPDVGVIEVHFNNDRLDATLATDPLFYRLFYSRGTATGNDDVLVTPELVTYNAVTNIARLQFAQPLARVPDPDNPGQFLTDGARLRIGQRDTGPNINSPLVPQDIALTVSDAGDSFDTAYALGGQFDVNAPGPQTVTFQSEIVNTTPYGLDLPAGPAVPGVQTIRPEDPTRLDRVVPLDYLRRGADRFDGISTIYYDFADSFLGDDPNSPGIDNDTTYFNIISEQQKDRVREALHQFSQYLGIQFVETNGGPAGDAFFTIAVGDLYGGDPSATSGDGGLAVVTRDRNGDGFDDLGVMDFQDFDESTDDQFGGEFFRGAMLVIGQLLGYGYADDLPQPVTQSTDSVFNPGTDNEAAFPSIADIVNGQYMYRPDSTDIDLYQFELTRPGTVSIQTFAERLPEASLLDTSLRLYRELADGTFEELAANDDYFSRDSLIELELTPGNYVFGVSASGNDSYDPAIEGTGFGGRTEGSYELRMNFVPSDDLTLKDITGKSLDGDADGRPGGVHNFWFVPADPSSTLYVDKAASSVGNGSINTPYRDLDDAIAAAQPGQTIRVVANGGADGLVHTFEDNFSYQIGVDAFGNPLQDGSSLTVPQGVTLVIDAGAVFKMQRSRVGIGSTSPTIDYSGAALQLLGTPTLLDAAGRPVTDDEGELVPGSVIFTSFNDDSVGAGNSPTFTPVPQAGDWGGLDFRGDLDAADQSRFNPEQAGLFLNHVQFADIRYGGGRVSVDGRSVVISPIDMAITRPTIVHSQIRNSADAAMAATPDTFAETRFDEPLYQAGGAFVPDYSRVGPDIHNNQIVGNSLNGLFVRVVTRAGSTLQPLTVQARFDDIDIPHILTENLVIEGTPGGPLVDSTAPSILLVNLTAEPATGSSSIPAGTYAYRITNVEAGGQESAASTRTAPVTLATPGGVRLTQLPRVPADGSFTARRLYRAPIDPATGQPTGPFELVAQLNSSTTTYVDTNADPGVPLVDRPQAFRARLDARLDIDPGTVLKIDSARIEARFGASLLAEGDPGLPVVFTSLQDSRYGGSGTFDTNSRGRDSGMEAGDWGGIYLGQGASGSFDNAVIAGAGGTTRIEGGFADFNALEVHQADLRLASSKFEFNADGREGDNGDRVGRGSNAAGTVFVRASQPVIVDNVFLGGEGAAITVDVNSLSYQSVGDTGRSTGRLDSVESLGNSGPLVRNNRLDDNDVNGMHVRGGELATRGVWDDYDIVHVVRDTIEVPNQFVYGGLQLESDARGSLVVKFQDDTEPAGLVIGGSLLTAEDQLRGIRDRIGGSLQLIGHPDFPVVLTTLADDFAGAGFRPDGQPQLDTNNDGLLGGNLTDQTGDSRLPTGPEVNNGLLIDNDVAQDTAGFFSALMGDGNEVVLSGVTALTTNQQLLINQDYVFAYTTYVVVGGTVTELSGTTITQPATLVSDDRVESRGTFAGPNGTVNWVATSLFQDGSTRLTTQLDLSSDGGGAIGDVQVISYLDEDVLAISDDILYTTGTPGQPDFRVFTIDDATRVGFSQGGYYTNDGVNQTGAQFEGWAADQFNDLVTAITAGTATFSVTGDIDTVDLPQGVDAGLGTTYGPNDVTTAFAWRTDVNASTSRITSFLELVPEDPSQSTGLERVTPGLWNGVTIREAASDRNVAAIAENESVAAISPGTNAIPGQSQFLGELAPSETAGDENRRIGFVVDGFLSQRDDVDVYSFIAESGTQVWFDIDRTDNSLDAVLELIDANGMVLARSNDSLAEEADPSLLFVSDRLDADSVRPMSEVSARTETQVLTIGGNVADAQGFLNLSLFGSAVTVAVEIDEFLANPAGSIQAAINANYRDVLGPVTVSLARRVERVVDPTDPTNVLEPGGDYELEVRFDNDLFLGSDVPNLAVDDSLLNIPGGGTVAMSARQEIDDSVLQDLYSTNRRDPGMRIVLPGENGTRNLYHIRVRSNDSPADPGVRKGLTSGAYNLQLRLRETDETPGTQVKFADVRYATTGLQIIGQPFHSPLLGEEYEQSAPNDTFAQAQPLGPYGVANDGTSGNAGPLNSDRLAKTIGGMLDSEDDIDWYQFDVRYEKLTRDNAALYLATIFDLDYADNFARADMAFYIYDAAGNLIMTAGDSNIADDQPRAGVGVDGADLSRGSGGTLDPYLGTTELSEGTYYVAISNQTRIPQQMDQFYVGTPTNPLLRLEPIDSVTRIAEDHIGHSGGGTAGEVQVPVLFDPAEAAIDYTLDDVVMYTIGRNNTGIQQTVNMINPFTGENYGSIGLPNQDIADFAFLPNGELFGYNRDLINGNPPNDTGVGYYRISSEDAGLTAIGASNIETYEVVVTADGPSVVRSDDGVHPEAMTFFGDGLGFFVGNRTATPQVGTFPNQRPEYLRNIVYQFDPQTGQAFSGAAGDRIVRTITVGGEDIQIDERASGAGTQIRERGYIETRLLDTAGNVLNPNTALRTQFVVTGATEVGLNGQTQSLIVDDFAAGGPTTFTIIGSDSTPYTFEFDSGPAFTFQYDDEIGASIRDGDQITVTTSSGATTYEFNTGPVLAVDSTQVVDGAQVVLTDAAGIERTFEFDQNGSVSAGAIAVAMRDENGDVLAPEDLYAGLADTITRADFGIVARATESLGRISLAGDSEAVLPTVSGSGLAVEGDFAVTPGMTEIRVEETATAEEFAQAMAAAIGNGTTVSHKGNRINFRGATDVDATSLQIANVFQTQTGRSGVSAGSGNIAVPFSVSDRDVDIAIRVAQAINNAGLGTTTAAANGRTVTLNNGAVTRNSVNPAFEVVNVSPGGTIRGIAMVGNVMYGVSDAGGLYRVTNPTGYTQGNIGDYVDTATDLVGINFTGLVRGPQTVEGGRYSNLLFGTTADGRVYAFNTAGELQPIFVGGQTNIDANGNGAVRGVAFSTLDRNLWGVTGTRRLDPGHGINPTFNGTRQGQIGGSSLYFGYERNNTGFANANVTAPRSAIGGNPLNVPRQDGQPIDNTYNFPGGAYGALESNPFSLVGYSSADQPYLYFNYFLESDNGLDAFRVYVVTEDGAEHLVSTNASFRDIGLRDDQYDEPTPGDGIDVDVQETFDNSDSWRQARVPLGEFAGRKGLRLRVEFSSSGQVGGGDPAIRALPGAELRDGQGFTISGQDFYLSFGPTVVTPPGSDIAAYYAAADAGVPGSAPDTRVTVNVAGITFVLNDGFRNVDTAAGEVNVPLFDPSVAGATPVARLTANEIASLLAPILEANAPAPVVDSSFDYAAESNDELSSATPVPLPDANATFTGTGRIEDPQDVDLFRVDLPAGATLEVMANPELGSSLTPRVRVFDSEGNPVSTQALPPFDPANPNRVLDFIRKVDVDTTYYVGISSQQNGNYNPTIAGSGTDGDVGNYTAEITVLRDYRVITNDNRIELTGGFPVMVPADSPLAVEESLNDVGLPVAVDSSMTAREVADAIREAAARRFAKGQLTGFGNSSSLVEFTGLSVDDSGPFGVGGNRYGDVFGDEGPRRTRDNTHEGVYIDDIIIGFAERGELATGATVDTGFIVDPSPNLTNPPQPVSELVTGSYQLEIRDASEYVASLFESRFRALDTNTRLTQSQTITAKGAADLVDGQIFTIGDGNAAVTFEFDLTESNTGVAPGNVAIPYTFEAIDPLTGLVRPQTPSEVAASIVTAINSQVVQSVLGVSAQLSSGPDSLSDPQVNLLGLSLVDNSDNALQNVTRAGGRGDNNRDRDAQGVILVENSRFLFNSQYGIDLVHDVTADVAGNTTDSLVRYPRNLVELNTEALVPGVVVQSNVLAYNDVGGLRVSGIENGGSDRDPVPFDRIVNNTIIGGAVTPGRTAPAQIIQGTSFSQGVLSFADAVVSYSPGANGGPEPDAEFQDTLTVLGPPDLSGRGAEPVDGSSTLSLGNGGVLVVQFVDNRLTGSGDSRPDLAIFETGDVESVLVEVSRDGVTYTEVGIAGGLTNQLDIDAAGFGPQDRLAFVRLTDLRQGTPGSSTIGADIDAVGAIFSASVDLFVPGGTGITVRQNASPTLLNNVIANSDVGLDVDASSNSSVTGASAFYRNDTAVSGTTSLGTFPQIVPESEELFVSAGELIFTPASGASIIDASIDSLQDRASLVTVRNPLGLPPSPIIAPRFDVNGQLRVDDPNVESPFGSGEIVFKDRGAEDRGDTTGPRAVLVTPRAEEQGTLAGTVEVVGAPQFFEIQLVDGIAPSDPVPGVGVDDRSVTSSAILLLENGVPLVDGVDYRFGYNPSTNTIRLTALAGVFRTDAVYVIRMLDSADSVIQASAGSDTIDGHIFNVVDRTGVLTPFEYESGITLTVPQNLVDVTGVDGTRFTVTDGRLRFTFELDDDNSGAAAGSVAVPVPVNATVDEIAEAIASVVNQSALNLTAVATGDGQVNFTGTDTLSVVDPLQSGMTVRGSIGTQVGFGIGIPADVALPDGVEDGQTFTIRRGAVQEVVFEIDTNNSLSTPGAARVEVPANPTMDQLATALVSAISSASLGLAPVNVGGGRIVLGGDTNYSLDMSDTVLTQLGTPGQTASVPIQIAPDASPEDVADTVVATIEAANLPGITAQRVGSRVYIDGSTDVVGDSVLNLVTIQDEVGNLLQSNQANGQTELTIFVGGGFDYGDAPAPYQSSLADGGPRLKVDDGLRLGATVTADSDAKLPNADQDDGVTFSGALRRGFDTTINVDVQSDGLAYVLDILVDWNGDGAFDGPNEAMRFNSPFLGSTALSVPGDAVLGETYARVIVTGQRTDPETGQSVSVGEIEDYPITIQNNPYQNPAGQFDVNGTNGVTPLDALLVINALNRYPGNSIPLDPPPAGVSLPPFPDVDGNGAVEPRDALLVVNELNRLYRNDGQGEAAARSGSVFDQPAAMALEDVLDSLADDHVQSQDGDLAVDRVFSQLGE